MIFCLIAIFSTKFKTLSLKIKRFLLWKKKKKKITLELRSKLIFNEKIMFFCTEMKNQTLILRQCRRNLIFQVLTTLESGSMNGMNLKIILRRQNEVWTDKTKTCFDGKPKMTNKFGFENSNIPRKWPNFILFGKICFSVSFCLAFQANLLFFLNQAHNVVFHPNEMQWIQ